MVLIFPIRCVNHGNICKYKPKQVLYQKLRQTWETYEVVFAQEGLLSLDITGILDWVIIHRVKPCTFPLQPVESSVAFLWSKGASVGKL